MGATPDKWREYELTTNYRTDGRLLEEMDVIFQKLGSNSLLPYAYDTDHLVSRIDGGAEDDELLCCVPYHGRKSDTSLNETLLSLLKREKDKILEFEKSRRLSQEEKTIAILVRKNWQIDNIVKGCKELDESIEIETKVGGDLYRNLVRTWLCIDLYAEFIYGWS